MKTIKIQKGMLESLIVMASVVESRDKYTGEVLAHKKGNSFEYEFVGMNETYVAEPDFVIAGKFVSDCSDIIKY